MVSGSPCCRCGCSRTPGCTCVIGDNRGTVISADILGAICLAVTVDLPKQLIKSGTDWMESASSYGPIYREGTAVVVPSR